MLIVIQEGRQPSPVMEIVITLQTNKIALQMALEFIIAIQFINLAILDFANPQILKKKWMVAPSAQWKIIYRLIIHLIIYHRVIYNQISIKVKRTLTCQRLTAFIIQLMKTLYPRITNFRNTNKIAIVIRNRRDPAYLVQTIKIKNKFLKMK